MPLVITMSKIPDIVLTVLSRCTVDANILLLPIGQLERDTYTKVDKVLKVLGGKWNRKHAGHVFDTCPSDLLDRVITTGEVETNQDVGHFPTPVKLAAELVRLAGVGHGDVCLEPSAGTGRIVDALLDADAHKVIAVERHADRAIKLAALYHLPDVIVYSADFMDHLPTEVGPLTIDRVVMNPPFCKVGLGDHLDHVRRAYAFLRSGGTLVSVLPSSVTFREDKRHVAFREWYESLGGEVKSLPANAFKESGTSVNTVTLRIGQP